MKKIIILIALFVSLAAQAYEPLIREDRIWEYHRLTYGIQPYSHHLDKFKFDGTEEKYGKTYHKFSIQEGFLMSQFGEDFDKVRVAEGIGNVGSGSFFCSRANVTLYGWPTD